MTDTQRVYADRVTSGVTCTMYENKLYYVVIDSKLKINKTNPRGRHLKSPVSVTKNRISGRHTKSPVNIKRSVPFAGGIPEK